MGLIVAPSCNDCHGVHDIKAGMDATRPYGQGDVAQTCGTCHVGVEKTYLSSVHGQLLAKGDAKAPVCTDCHTAHQIERPATRISRHERSKLRQMSRGATRQLSRDLPRQSHGARARRTSRRKSPPATTATGITTSCRAPTHARKLSAEQYRRHLREVPHRRERVVHSISAARRSARREELPALHGVYLFMTTLLVERVRVLRRAHRCFGSSARSTCICSDSDGVPRGQDARTVDAESFTRFNPFERFLQCWS